MSAEERRERARGELARRGWAGLVATPGVNFEYLTGIGIDRSERLVCLGLPADGEPWVVCPAFEAERVGAAWPEARLFPWEETNDPFGLAAARLPVGDGRSWAVEPSTTYHDASRLEAAAPGAVWVDGAELFEALRRPKDAAEVAALRRAIDVAWEVHDRIVPSLVEGPTEEEVAAAMLQAFAARGYEGWALVQFGPGSAVPHGEPGSRPLQRGQAVLLDWGGWGGGFTADLTRSFWWDGEPAGDDAPAEYREILALVQRAQRTALDAMAPGVPCGEVDEAARRVIRDAGHGERFMHRLGHGLGREIHEPPYLVGGSDVALAPGDVVTVEPGVYLPDRFGVRWEDDVLVTDGGIEILSNREVNE